MTLLFSFMRPYRRLMMGVLALVSLVTLTGLAAPYLLAQMIGGLAGGDVTIETLIWAAVALSVLYVVRSGAAWGVFHFSHVAAWNVCHDMRRAVYAKLQTLSADWYAKRKSGDVVSRVVKDTMDMEPIVADAVYGALVSILMGVGVFIVLCTMSPMLAVLALAPFPFALWGLVRIGRDVQPAFDAEANREGELSALTQDHVSGMTQIQLFGRQAYEAHAFNKMSDTLKGEQIHARRVVAGFDPIVEGAAGVSMAIVILAGGVLALRQGLPIEVLLTFVLYVTVLYQPLFTIVELAENVQRGLASLKRIASVLDEVPSVQDPTNPMRIARAQGAISLRNVDFDYGADAPTLRDISLDIAPGEMVAIVGQTGAGKSTLAALIGRLYDATGGDITLDGTPLHQIALSDLRAQVSYVMQDVFLFNGTVRDNIRFGRGDVSDINVEQATQTANAHDFIKALPKGYDTQIGERGIRLSGGQKQRLSIARAVLKDAPILILDEATASIDTQTERQIQASLESQMVGRTSIVIAHRLSTIQNADKIVVLKDGQIAQIGSHAKIATSGGPYAELLGSHEN